MQAPDIPSRVRAPCHRDASVTIPAIGAPMNDPIMNSAIHPSARRHIEEMPPRSARRRRIRKRRKLLSAAARSLSGARGAMRQTLKLRKRKRPAAARYENRPLCLLRHRSLVAPHSPTLPGLTLHRCGIVRPNHPRGPNHVQYGPTSYTLRIVTDRRRGQLPRPEGRSRPRSCCREHGYKQWLKCCWSRSASRQDLAQQASYDGLALELIEKSITIRAPRSRSRR